MGDRRLDRGKEKRIWRKEEEIWNKDKKGGRKETRVSLLAIAGLGGSVGCAVRLETRRSRVQPPPRSATFFRGD